MEAVIASGGKQYRVSPGQVISVEKVPGDKGGVVEFRSVLLVTRDGYTKAGWAALGLHRAGFRAWGVALLLPFLILGFGYSVVWLTGIATLTLPSGRALALLPLDLAASIVIATLFAGTSGRT